MVSVRDTLDYTQSAAEVEMQMQIFYIMPP